MDKNFENRLKVFNDRPKFLRQTIALVKRNFLIKKRNRGRTLLELLFPVYMIVVIIAIKSVTKPETSDAIPEPVGNGTNWNWDPFFSRNQWFIVSQDKELVDSMKIIIPKILINYSEHIVFNDTFTTSQDIERYYISSKDEIKFAIIFDTKNDNNISYTIRMPYKSVPNDLNDYGSVGNCRDKPFTSSCDEMKYFSSGFAFLQTVIDSALIEKYMPKGYLPPATLSLFPKPQFVSSSTMWRSFVPTYVSWIFIPSVSILTVMFVLEKERKIKEGMLMMGLRVSAYWLGWIVTQAVLVLIVSLFVTVILYFTAIIERINVFILFILIFLYGISMIGVSAIISPFFKKEKAAGSFVSFFTLIAGLVHLLMVFLDIPSTVYYLLALVSPVAFSLGMNSITLQTTSLGNDIGFSNIFDDPNFSVGSAILMLLVDCILYGLLAIYLDQVIPGEYGPKQSFYFFLKKSFWFPSKSKSMANFMNEDTNYELRGDVEEISDEMRGKLAISIENLTKIYGKGEKKVIAVNDLSFRVYESQITGLLGHNGAGKSTLINMMVGNIAPTSGTAHIYGDDISNPIEMNALRQTLGVCLQQDILFDELNCVEHLNFFAEMKGIPNAMIAEEVNKLLSEVQLFAERLTPSKKLSGGQKRKLSVAIALIANPKVIFLDEPSSGVDPYSRRQLWSLLQSYKKDRVIILSTHFMDEADVLADRKAIIANGRLRCIGSSMFLKNKFGIGYHLTVGLKNGSNVDNVNALVKSHITNAEIDRFTTSEAFYILPMTETQLFPQLFDALEQNISNGNGIVDSFGISMTTLEEVFLKIGDEVEAENSTYHTIGHDSEPIRMESLTTDDRELNPNFWQSFKAFIYIRILIFIRNPMHSIPIILMPILMILISYFLMKNNDIKNLSPNSLLLKPNIYQKNANILYKNTTIKGIENFISLVDQMGVKAQSVVNFTIDSVANNYMAVNIRSLEAPIDWDFLFNDTYIHSLPILQNLMTNVYNSLTLPKPSKPINTFNHPFPQTDKDSDLYTFDPKVYTYVILMAVMLGSIPASIGVEVVEDRDSKIKNLLRVCGLGFITYWFTTLVCHMIMFLMSCLLVLIATIFIIKVEFLQDSEAIVCVFILFALFIPASLIASYVWLHLFDKKDTARSVMPLICYMPGMIMVILVSIISASNPDVGKMLHKMFCIVWPFYVPQGGLFFISMTSNFKKIIKANEMEDQIKISYFDWDQNITICFFALSFHVIFYSFLLVFVDRLKSGQSFSSALGFKRSSPINRAVPSHLEDDDVRRERDTVRQYSSHNKTPIVLLNELQKRFSNSTLLDVLRNRKCEKTVIQNISLLLESGHIFGLLGPNGAGKTTTIKIIICEENQSEGKVLISGHEVKSSDSEIFKLIGYCPQHDSLWKEITLKEHIHMFAAIRGIPQKSIERVCQNYIESMKISEHSNKRTEQLSGGTKRKLCYLMALLGRSKLVLLDEPSTGMDPKAKRFLWKSILSAFEPNSNRSAILTTHSMEETDALCTRVGIMVKGVMRCIGSLQHLKNKYGAGYVLEIKWRQTNDLTFGQRLKQMIESFLTEVIVKEEYNNRLILDIPQHSVESLSRIFNCLEKLRINERSIEEYSFSQKTIEQVFIDFAKQQDME